MQHRFKVLILKPMRIVSLCAWLGPGMVQHIIQDQSPVLRWGQAKVQKLSTQNGYMCPCSDVLLKLRFIDDYHVGISKKLFLQIWLPFPWQDAWSSQPLASHCSVCTENSGFRSAIPWAWSEMPRHLERCLIDMIRLHSKVPNALLNFSLLWSNTRQKQAKRGKIYICLWFSGYHPSR